MSHHPAMAEHAGAFLPAVHTRSRDIAAPVRAPSQAKPGMRDSFAAGALMLVYVAAYVAVGFAALALLKWAWAGIFG
jgi:hypothetical protein